MLYVVCCRIPGTPHLIINIRAACGSGGQGPFVAGTSGGSLKGGSGSDQIN